MARAGRHAALVAALATYWWTVGTASAHGFGGGGRVGFAPVVGLTVGTGVLAGALAAVRGGGPGRDLTATLVGPALVALGALAALAAASRGLVVVGGGLLAGGLETAGPTPDTP
jgi:hypothetical protein